MGLQAINWNTIEDDVDLQVWNRMTSNFWLPEKIALSNDVSSWSRLTDAERELTMKVFAGLTRLDTIQGTVGAVALLNDAQTDHEEANYTFISAMESIHAKSYSSIFSTLASTRDIDEAFRWANTDPRMNRKVSMVGARYGGSDPLKKKIASVFLESFLFYSGFYLPFRLASRGDLTNTSDLIRLIVRDEAVHGYYIGYKYQVGLQQTIEDFPDDDIAGMYRGYAYELLDDLMDIEVEYAQSLYDGVGWTDDVKKYLRYNANKALNNLGYESLYTREQTSVSPAIISSLSLDSENHDFFSGSGSSYVIGKTEQTEDSDWAF